MTKHRTTLSVIIPLAVALVAGCTWVKKVDVPVELTGGQAKLTGTPKETLDYFEERYPPESWAPATAASRVAVGPICMSREAVIQLTGEEPEEIYARAEAGTTRSIISVRSGERDLFFYVARTSQDVQAIVVEQLVSDPGFRVFALEEDQTGTVLDGTMSYHQLRRDGVRYYADGSVVTTDDSEAPTRVHLRFVDTATKEIVCATAGEGYDLPEAAHQAAVALAQSLTSRRGLAKMGG